MTNDSTIARTPSPSHSVKQEDNFSESANQAIHSDPHPSWRIISGADSPLVSVPTPAEDMPARKLEHSPMQEHYGDPSLYHTSQGRVYYPIRPAYAKDSEYHTPPRAIMPTGPKTRSGRNIHSPMSTSTSDFERQSPSPRMKKTPRSAKAGKSRSPQVDQPLSVATKDYSVPVKDMGLWVHRPLEDRMKDVEKKKGHISRPMNSFMLYRSAYSERAKQFCKENNHQVVSQVTGASWPLEPKEVREMYEEYANVERDNHQAAHPSYKFAPNKNAKKRSQIDDDASDDDPDWEGSTRSAKRSRTGGSESSTPFDDRVPRHQPAQYHPSSYQATNPFGPRPIMMAGNGFGGQYYQQSVTPYGQRMEDVKFEPVDIYPEYELDGPLLGYPSQTQHELLESHYPEMASGQIKDMLDPQLAHYDPNLQYGSNEDAVEYAGGQNYEYGSYRSDTEFGYPPGANYHPGLATLTDGRTVWTEPEHIGMDFDNELQQWN